MSSIGWSVCSSHSDERRRARRRRRRRRRRPCGSVQPFAGPSMMPNSKRAEADDRQHRAERVELALVGVLRLRDRRRRRATSAMAPIGTLTQNTELHEKCSSRRPPVTGPIGDAEPGEAGPDGDRPAPLVRVAEHVGQDRQRRRHDQRAADAHERSADDQLHRRRRQGGRHRADREQDDADLQRALAAEAVAEAAGRQQQAGEHEGVGVDDPLDLAVGGVRGRSISDGIATLRIVLSITMISSERHSVARINQRAGVHVRVELLSVRLHDRMSHESSTCPIWAPNGDPRTPGHFRY